VGGYSFGGIVAYEMLRQLGSAKVKYLLLIDQPPLDSNPRPIPNDAVVHFAVKFVKSYYKKDLLYSPQQSVFQLNHLVSFISAQLPKEIAEQVVYHIKIYAICFISLLQVHNAPSNQRVSSPVGLVRSTQSANKSPDYGWADWTTEKVSCFSIDASHFDLLNGDNVSLVAQYLKSILLVKVQFK